MVCVMDTVDVPVGVAEADVVKVEVGVAVPVVLVVRLYQYTHPNGSMETKSYFMTAQGSVVIPTVQVAKKVVVVCVNDRGFHDRGMVHRNLTRCVCRSTWEWV